MKLDTMFRWLVFPGVLAGFMLHAYTCFLIPDGGPNGFTAGLFALSILPYLACLVAGMRNARGLLMAAYAILPLLLLDSLTFHEAFIAPSTSTSSLALLVVPVINLGVLALGFLVGWIVFRLRRRAT
ncbi:MAG: hypothetical protein GX772_02425 [Alcaligenaceae bacterium]|nr:hypothetical protein [Alcaligenaceae bacterium]